MSWAARLPRVTVPMSATPKRVTLVVPYYECPTFFQRQFQHWSALTFDRALSVSMWSVVVVDDGSPEAPADRAFPMSLGERFRLFRIERDIPWNWLAARNIGAHHAEDGWLLLTDIDHVVPAETLKALIYGQHDPSVVYVFSRREHTGAPLAPHSASFFMTKAMFWQIGGYDERLSGVYGTDGLYRKRLLSTAPVQVLTDELHRYEFVDDASVQTYERKTPAMAQARAARIASLPAGPPSVLTFPYHEVHA